MNKAGLSGKGHIAFSSAFIKIVGPYVSLQKAAGGCLMVNGAEKKEVAAGLKKTEEELDHQFRFS